MSPKVMFVIIHSFTLRWTSWFWLGLLTYVPTFSQEEMWHPHRTSAQLEKGNSSHLLIKHELQRFATQFWRPNEFEDDWNKHCNSGSDLAEFWLISMSSVVCPSQMQTPHSYC